MKKATQQQVKDHNYHLVLRTIFQFSPLSRAEIARRTDLTKTTVSEIVGELLAAGLVVETGYGASEGGKPPTLLTAQKEARQVICVDLGSVEFRGALSTLDGQLSNRINISIQEMRGEAAVKRLYVLLDTLVSAAVAPVLGIGIGAPGLIDPESGVIHTAINLGWEDLALKTLLEGRYHVPCYIANDCAAAALAELTYGQQQRSSSLVLIKSGEGIGAGIVLMRQLLVGDSWSSGEIGHLQVTPEGNPCICGNTGCLESVASNRSILQQAVRLGCLASERANRPEEDTFLRLAELFHQGDPKAQKLILETGRYFGVALASLCAVLNVRQIVISGAISAFGEDMLNAARKEMSRRVLPSLAAETRLVFSRLGQDIVMLGAAALVMTRELFLE